MPSAEYPSPKPTRYAFFAMVLLVVGFSLRLPQLTNHELHVDESLYADVSRHVLEHGDLLINGAKSDKPPLLYWCQATCFLFFGVTESATRIPGLLAWAMTALVLWMVLSKVWGEDLSLMALTLWCLSPYGIVFTPTGFTDPLMASLGTCGLVYLIADMPFAAGIFMGLSLASKQTGLLYLSFAFVSLREPTKIKEFLKGYAWIVLPLLLWSIGAADPRFGIWTRTAQYAAASPDVALQDRAKLILHAAFGMGGSIYADALIGILLLLGFGSALRYGKIVSFSVILYVAFLVLYNHGSFFDRYLLWLLGPLALGVAAGLEKFPKKIRLAVILILGLGLCFNWEYGGAALNDGSENQGFREAKIFMDANMKATDTIYLLGKMQDQGWKAQFYFHPKRGQGVNLEDLSAIGLAKNPGWVLGLNDVSLAMPPIFDSKEGLKIWKQIN